MCGSMLWSDNFWFDKFHRIFLKKIGVKMRIHASVQICNRDLPSHNKSQRKKEESCLTIGTLGKSQVSILHQTAKDNSGVRYKILGNLIRVHTRFLAEGKASLSFKSPPVDMLIETEADQLSKFLKIIDVVVSGKNVSKLKLTNLATLTKFPCRPKIKLIINTPSKLRTQGYPRSITHLTINNCGISKLDRGVLRLQFLIELDLCDNKITNLPEQLDFLPHLRCLILSNNCLGTSDWKWLDGQCLQQNLTLLDLSGNSIKFLPRNIGKLKGLRQLELKNNELRTLPDSLLRLPKLKYLNVQDNQLRWIPFGFINFRLYHFNLSGNRELFENKRILKPYTPRMLTLKELAGRAVYEARVSYDEMTIPRELVAYLGSGSFCACRKMTFPDVSDVGVVITSRTSNFCSNIETSGLTVNVNVHPCSFVCYNKLIN